MFRGLHGVHITLRPADSQNRLAILSIEGFDGFVSSTAASIATGCCDKVAGWGMIPTENQHLHDAPNFEF
jgi:hypothetical protein